MLRRSIPELTTLRFFAALAVVLSHMHGLGLIQAQGLHDFLDGGRTAVAFFFVLSGFVLALRYSTGDSFDGYATARFARVYPMHFLTLLLSVPAVLLIVQTSPEMAANLFFVKEHAQLGLTLSFFAQVFLLTAWIPFAVINQPWNGPSWSLSCEAFFYICFPWLRRKMGAMPLRVIVGLLITGFIIQGIWLLAVERLLPTGRAVHVIYQFPLSHFFEFVAGVSLVPLLEGGSANVVAKYRRRILLASVVAMAGLSYFSPIEPAYYLMSPLFVILIGAIAIAPRPNALLTNRYLILLGSASYSLYLVHVPALLMLRALHLYVHPAAVLVGLVGLSVLLFMFAEEPLRRRILNWRGKIRLAPAGN